MDNFLKTGASTVTTLAAPGKALADTSITVGSTTNYPLDTDIVFAIRQVDTNGDLVAGTYTEWIGTVTSGTTLSMVATPVYGSDQVYPAGSTTQVYIPLSSYAHNRMIDALLGVLDQDGTLKDDSVGTGQIQDEAVTTGKLDDTSVSTAKLQDSSVTYAKTDGKIWWEEIGRTTLNSAGSTISITSIPARKYVKIIGNLLDNGSAVTGTMTFNNDSGANYAQTNSTAGAADGSLSSQNSLVVAVDSAATPRVFEMELVNNSAKEKLFQGHAISQGAAGAATVPIRREINGKWANTSAQITRVDVATGTANNFAIGSEVVVLGHN